MNLYEHAGDEHKNRTFLPEEFVNMCGGHLEMQKNIFNCPSKYILIIPNLRKSCHHALHLQYVQGCYAT